MIPKTLINLFIMLNTTDETFDRHVLAAHNPVMVYFWAPWCKLCHLVEPTLLKTQGEFPVPLQIARVNADENLKLAATYRLKILPTLVLFAQGELIYRLEGFPGRDELYRSLSQASLQLLTPSL
jgi:thioredoxin 1